MQDKLILKFDPHTIEHLGISLYSKLPSVLAELISNSWDADSDDAIINFIDNEKGKEIEYSDTGVGMTFEELNEKYLLIGRNRRAEVDSRQTEKGRKVIGKKGLGKLSVFGICDSIEVISIKNGFKNHFKMNLADIKSSKGEYSPELLISKNSKAEVNEKGTKIFLKQIRRKSAFDLESIAISLSKKFVIFDKMNVELLSNGTNKLTISNELKFNLLNEQFRWTFPDKKFDDKYEYWNSVKGFIITTATPIKDTDMRGVYLVSRGKIVNTAEFYGLRDNDFFYSYASGYIEIDFIDDFDEDVISTDRLSLNWENDKTKELQTYLQTTIRKISNEWKSKKSNDKKEDLKNTKSIDIDNWQKDLPTYERELSNKIINPILENDNIDIEESSKIVSNVIDKFENQDFKKYASKIADISKPEDVPNLINLIDEWKIIESKHYKDLSITRVEVIKQFEEHLKTNTKEVPTLHNFLKKFSWLLDPRILEFKDEIRYSTLLKESFPEEDLDEKDRRIDFLCSNALGEILYVIEIKRSLYKVDTKAIDQAFDYASFLKNKYASATGFSKVVCYVIGGEKNSDDYKFKEKERAYSQSGDVFVKTYTELLEQSKEYHKEFIDAYNEHTDKNAST